MWPMVAGYTPHCVDQHKNDTVTLKIKGND